MCGLLARMPGAGMRETLATARERFRREAEDARKAGDFDRWWKAILGFEWAKDDARKERWS